MTRFVWVMEYPMRGGGFTPIVSNIDGEIIESFAKRQNHVRAVESLEIWAKENRDCVVHHMPSGRKL